ncbi:MAG: undecaprenyl-diphosphate phosphatase [Rikenellaceae bacterium]|nr:undecaprenyl-diphosphate phosphatase [Rikenellaceae bacterium]
MSIIEAIIMGLVQGLTEFLPVSSSGHLEIANTLLGIEAEENLAFATVLHGGTVLSTIVVFRKELARIITGFFRFQNNTEMRFVINILVSMLPIMFVGFFFKDKIEVLFSNNLLLVGSMLIVTALLLLFSGYAKSKNRDIAIKDAFIIGIAQAIAVIPGISRSGATISTGLLLGVKREEVASFSFLMVLIPTIGINFLDIIGGDFSQASVGTGTGAFITGFITSFISGVFACKVMINLVKKGKLVWFAVYCFAMGIFSIIYSFI